MSRIQMTLRLAAGFFQTDPAAGFFYKAFEILSRAVWQQPQTLIGFLFNLWAVWTGRATRVDYYFGTVAVTGSGINKRSASLGIYLCLAPGVYSSETNVGTGPGCYTTMHELGHTLQSRILGPFYLFVIGIPSASGAWFCEVDANRRAALFFSQRVKDFRWDPDYYPRGTFKNLYSRFVKMPEAVGGKGEKVE